MPKYEIHLADKRYVRIVVEADDVESAEVIACEVCNFGGRIDAGFVLQGEVYPDEVVDGQIEVEYVRAREPEEKQT